ncbi:hypothetical protein AVEN_189775-1, partial [Araneus ventricosus]
FLHTLNNDLNDGVGFELPTPSPDFYPLENVWDIFTNSVYRNGELYSSVEEPRAPIEDAQFELKQEHKCHRWKAKYFTEFNLKEQ